VQFFNCYIVPLCVCWSLPTAIMPNFYLLQYVFTSILSIWLIYRVCYNTKLATHFAVCVGQQDSLLSNCSVSNFYDSDEHNAKSCAALDSSTTEAGYQICSRSRYTQFCIFLVLESKQHRVVSSNILFKWQLTESHFRALTFAIAQHTAVVKRIS
jgi:hypothetical protein